MPSNRMTSDGPPPIPQILIVVGGDDASGSGARDLGSLVACAGPDTLVIAADSGLDVAVAAGLPVDHLVGDLDSVSAEARRSAEARGVRVHHHAPDKDATDLELAIELALELAGDATGERGAITTLTVIGPGAGRLDHLLADIALLASPRLAGLEVRARFGPADLVVVPGGTRRTLGAAVGEQVSLLPVHGPAGRVTTKGLRWALLEADLVPGTTRGVSNEVVDAGAVVAVGEGTVVVVRPGRAAPDVPARTTAYDPTPRAEAAPPGGPTQPEETQP
jgi:thiamine pyrophosphokinase